MVLIVMIPQTLLEACKTGNVDVAKELIETGADFNQTDEVRALHTLLFK